MTDSVWLCPGTYDPITYGHLDVITRFAPRAGTLVVGVIDDPGHKARGLLDVRQRVSLAEQVTAHLPNVTVRSFGGLAVEFARELGADTIVRGLRNGIDLEYEFQIDQNNRVLAPEITTMYVLASPQWSFCSSSAVRELHRHGADISTHAPACVVDTLQSLT